jgi:hypothetical protein
MDSKLTDTFWLLYTMAGIVGVFVWLFFLFFIQLGLQRIPMSQLGLPLFLIGILVGLQRQ